MWTSIKDIIIPKDFTEAIEANLEPNTTYFSGGTYLVAEKNKTINTLIDINELIDDKISVDDNSISIGAGAKVQDIVNNSQHLSKLALSAKQSIFSKNIRNQRTLGGEIAQKNIRSDLFVYLITLNPILEIMNPKIQQIKLREWDGIGIINRIIINKIDLNSSGFERFAILPSAPAFLMVAVARKAMEIDFVISGKIHKIYGHTMSLENFSKHNVKKMINKSAQYFKEDQYGSVEYKKALITTGIQRAVEQL
jgi:putative selenate reductase FAD-binding subunit